MMRQLAVIVLMVTPLLPYLDLLSGLSPNERLAVVFAFTIAAVVALAFLASNALE